MRSTSPTTTRWRRSRTRAGARRIRGRARSSGRRTTPRSSSTSWPGRTTPWPSAPAAIPGFIPHTARISRAPSSSSRTRCRTAHNGSPSTPRILDSSMRWRAIRASSSSIAGEIRRCFTGGTDDRLDDRVQHCAQTPLPASACRPPVERTASAARARDVARWRRAVIRRVREQARARRRQRRRRDGRGRHRILAPGGFLFPLFGPIWDLRASPLGHARRASVQLLERDPAAVLSPPAGEGGDRVAAFGPGPWRRAKSVMAEFVTASPQQNQLFYEDYERIFAESDFDVLVFKGYDHPQLASVYNAAVTPALLDRLRARHPGANAGEKRKRPAGLSPRAFMFIPATSYFPTQSPAQYHRRCGA